MTAKLDSAAVGLKWIDEPAENRPPIDPMPLIGEERSFEKAVVSKLKENLLVPFGLLATTACLTMGLYNMKQGDVQKQQMYMRGRVGFQAFTFVAMVSTIYLANRKRERQIIQKQGDAAKTD